MELSFHRAMLARTAALVICALIVLITLVFLSPRPAPALPRSAAGSTWARNYGGGGNDQANAVVATGDSGAIIAGATSSFGAGSGDAWLLKLDADGNATWQRTYGESGDDTANAIVATSDGGYVVAGSTSSFGASNYDAWVFKLDASGNVLWQKTYGGSGYDTANAIAVTGDGGYIVTGSTYSFGAGYVNAWVLKLDSSGNVTWQKTYGGSVADQANSVAVTGDGGYVVAGDTASFAGGNGEVNAWVLKLDANGNVIWQKTYGGNYVNEAYAVVATADGGYLVAGVTDAFSSGDPDAWVFKLDGNGNILWQKTYGGSEMDGAHGIAVTGDGGAIVAGFTVSFGTRAGDENAWVLKLDGNGNILWQKSYGGGNSDLTDAVALTGDGGYVVAGLTYSFGQSGASTYSHAWVLKLDANGNIGSSCSVIGISSATAANSTATTSTTSVTPGISAVTPVSSSATPADTSTTPGMICPAPPPTPTPTMTPTPLPTCEPPRTPGTTPPPWGTPYFLPYVEKSQMLCR